MTEAERVVVAQNIATNGRAFCVLLFAACLAVYLNTNDPHFLRLAVASSLPIGLTSLVERTSSRLLHDVLTAASVGILAGVSVSFFLV